MGSTLAELRARREEILATVRPLGADNVRVFGSVARGEDDDTSDVDLLIDVTSDARGWEYFGVVDDVRSALERLLGRKVDVLDSGTLQPRASDRPSRVKMRARVLRDATPL